MNGIPVIEPPHYSQSVANEPLCLYRGPVAVVQGSRNKRVRLQGRIVLTWLPRPNISAEVQGALDTNTIAIPFGGEDLAAEPPTFRRGVPGQRTNRALRGVSAPPTIHASVSLQSGEVGLVRESVPSVVFHGVNIPRMFTRRLVSGEGRISAERLLLTGGGWTITIDPAPNMDLLQEELLQRGGYAITHTIIARRQSGAGITVADAGALAEALTMFLWLGFGRNVGVALCVGRRASGDAAWGTWTLPVLRDTGPCWSWLDTSHSWELETLWPAFISMWQGHYWSDVFRLAVGYYVIANQPRPVNQAIATAQMILDMLAFSVLVTEGKLMSRGAFEERRSAAENMRALLAELSIPTAIPAELTHLSAFRIGGQPVDGPQAVAKFRNEVAHLRGSRSYRPTELLVDVWKLAMWYVEMVLFRLMGFRGMYRSRLSGSVQAVL